MSFVSFGNEKNSPHLNVDHIVSLELVEAPGHMPAVSIRATRAEADLRVEFATRVEAQDLIDSIIDCSVPSSAGAVELDANTAARPKRLPFGQFVADERHEPGE
ncbi:hypothetical protein [Hymenobacter arizonensis]|uniref:Uncharacterized protein n=1 Tax=Hymenobacter arizonensis TaxID=1227077 RepID=A0A1I5U339_HYMAR|nr:hypothetical protein [Hymenobacter arizonensis]SFP89690.1 hypothetical protein SAMN04515668_0741 [Hymenobacter arizonensis]